MSPKPPPPGKRSARISDSAEPLPSFPFFADPLGVGVLEKSTKACDCCGKARGWIYDGPVYSPGDEPTFCPWCIADGSAAEKFDSTFNDTGVLSHQPGDDREPPHAELEQVEARTPGFTTWQGNHWFACCGHAAVYQGDAGEDDLRGRWASAVPAILADAEGAFDDADDLITGLERGGSPGVYIFRCRHCGKLGGYFDMD